MFFITNFTTTDLTGIYYYYWDGMNLDSYFEMGGLPVFKSYILSKWYYDQVYIGWQLNETYNFEIAEPQTVLSNQIT